MRQKEFVDQHMGQWPVILISFCLPTPVSVNDLFELIREAICTAFDEHPYLRDWLPAGGEDQKKFDGYISRSVKVIDAAKSGS
jgi:hypothetical protein